MRGFRVAPKVFAVLLAMLFTYVTGTGQEESAPEHDACVHPGDSRWHDLSESERTLWCQRVLAMPRNDYLDRGARAFVEQSGFLPTEVMGPWTLGEGESPQLVAFREGKTYALSLPTIGAPLFPGLHWSRGMGSAWTVIQPDGSTATYWIDREL